MRNWALLILTVMHSVPDVCCGFEHVSGFSLSRRLRRGPAPHSFGCEKILEVTHEMRQSFQLPSEKILKFNEVYGIPIVSTGAVIDDALYRACYVTAFAFAQRADIRDMFYEGKGFVHVVSFAEKPDRDPADCKITGWWKGFDNQRGMPPTDRHPYVVAAEENLLCAHEWHLTDPFRHEDILLHMLAHTVISLMFAKDPRFEAKVRKIFRSTVKKHGKWRNKYAGKNVHEYFAEGAQSFFNVNVEGSKHDRIHGEVNTRHELRRYDHQLYKLVMKMFPCKNNFIRTCDMKAQQLIDAVWDLELNCKSLETDGVVHNCHDGNIWCQKWAHHGECSKNPTYMYLHCRSSCKQCKRIVKGCRDHHPECEVWSLKGECENNAGFMLVSCRLSCRNCKSLKERTIVSDDDCWDDGPQCEGWKINGECRKHPVYMSEYCRKSCHSCRLKSPFAGRLLKRRRKRKTVAILESMRINPPSIHPENIKPPSIPPHKLSERDSIHRIQIPDDKNNQTNIEMTEELEEILSEYLGVPQQQSDKEITSSPVPPPIEE